ncbi:MAG: hypothetical protein OEX00_04470, partial [Gammaproteobacteria bacterium]|nr:hypothetical protein [Gammaproteobacteria bacterium]
MAKPRLVQAPLPLEYTEQTPTRRVANHKAGPSHLWLAIQFPNIAIEISHPQAKTSASVTAQTVKGRLVVCSTSALAEETGIHIGMAVNAAYALCPGVHVFEHDEKRVANTMTELAAWAMQYTSYVSLYNSNTLLLEIRGSLKLFGQLENIKT